MKKSPAFWKSDWFLGLLVTIAFFGLSNSDVMQSLERKAYDLGVQGSSRAASDKIAVIAIDDQSIANIGRWPWSRDVHAKMIDLLSGAKTKVVGNTVFFSEPQIDPGLAYINKLSQVYAESNLKNTVDPLYQQDSSKFADVLKEAEEGLNTDRKLAESIGHANNVLLGMVFQLGDPSGNPEPLPEFVTKNNLVNVKGVEGAELPWAAESVLAVPIEPLGKSAAAIGHLNSYPDVDGGIRTEPLVLRYYDQYYPSFALMLAAQGLNLQAKDIQIDLGHGITLGKLKIRTNPNLQMYTYFYKDRDNKSAFPVDSFFDVFVGKIPADKYRDKIVLIGPTAAGAGDTQVTPISPSMSPVLTVAHTVSSILNEDFFVAPSWGKYAEYLVILLVGLYLALLLPRLKAAMGASITAGLLVAIVVIHFALMSTQLLWLQLMTSTVLLIVGHLLLTTKRYLVTERGKTKSDAESAESNRMLGLAFQGQGQLDMAFDKFRKCPLDDPLMDNLYNLALDFERKRQFNKAESVFKYMADYNPKFRDLEQRLNRAKQMSETVMLGGGGGRTNASTMILDGGTMEKPMLGRYQVEKELGKGAMGVVYLGKDPKIGRVVAIKTMALAQEFDADELEDVKSRFFREAETAGRLNHPNIVTIFDAGEEHDLAYIAMEFLKGKDLVPHVKPDNLLPLPLVMSIVARVAEALAYAHSQNVVHRDIKPANIMYEAESDTAKVTDFGIARITDSSKTKTGMVLGTPSYMSPEQLAGRKIDGKSDLFSLGVTLYQLACGQLPFQGDSMAQLMFKIANEPPIDVLSVRPDLPPCLVQIINRAIEKEPVNRFQSGEEMSRALRDCMAASKIKAVDIDL
jgi:eukaryotic-like serine/threonine-protein kinase